ncbi:MAG TPA: hypothetical protein VFL93_07485 [Longimicrobiaceae bacterium]|nr:hypothetical protein [Longimicrobiaceae bacterium]
MRRTALECVLGGLLATLLLGGCDSDVGRLMQQIEAARQGCTEARLQAGDSACVRMMGEYARMGTEAMRTSIGAVKSLDQALKQMPPPNFDTTGLGHALSAPPQSYLPGADSARFGGLTPSAPSYSRTPLGTYDGPYAPSGSAADPYAMRSYPRTDPWSYPDDTRQLPPPGYARGDGYGYPQAPYPDHGYGYDYGYRDGSQGRLDPRAGPGYGSIGYGRGGYGAGSYDPRDYGPSGYDYGDYAAPAYGYGDSGYGPPGYGPPGYDPRDGDPSEYYAPRNGSRSDDPRDHPAPPGPGLLLPPAQRLARPWLQDENDPYYAPASPAPAPAYPDPRDRYSPRSGYYPPGWSPSPDTAARHRTARPAAADSTASRALRARPGDR